MDPRSRSHSRMAGLGSAEHPVRLFLACGLVLLAACGRPDPLFPPRLVLLYATCTLNKRFLAPYDPSVAYTPNLARFAAGARVFERHQTESGQSGTAFASIFSGLQAPDHGVYRHPTRLADAVLLVTEAFAGAGYDVHAWLDHGMASAELGYAQGVPASNVHPGFLRAGDAAFEAVLDRLASDPGYRAFLVTDFTVTHTPYRDRFVGEFCGRHPEACSGGADELERWAVLHRSAFRALQYDFADALAALGISSASAERLIAATETLYASNVFHLDRLFGAVLDAIRARGLLERALVAFTSDHGEVLYREDQAFHWTHGLQLDPEVLEVAFVLYGPAAGVRPGRHAQVTRSVDVFPTLAGLAGVALPPDPRRGVDLSPAVRGREPAPALVAYSHTALYADAVLDRYRRFPAFARRMPAVDPALMWTASRRGDEWLRRRRGDDGRWRIELGERRRGVPFEDHFDPGDPRHRELAEDLARYGARLVAGFREREGVSRALETELLQRLGYIER